MTPSPPAEPTDAVTGTWSLRLDGAEVSDDVWLHLGGGDITGSTGCNHLRGRYEDTAVGPAVVGPVVTTLRAGPEPVMARERLVLAALHERAPLVVDGDALVVGAGDAALTYLRVEPDPEGTWDVTAVHRPEMEAIVSTGRPSSVAITGSAVVVTTPSGVVTGTTVVGRGGRPAPVEIDLGALPSSADDEDVALVDALGRARGWQLDGSVLHLLRDDGGIAVTLVR